MRKIPVADLPKLYAEIAKERQLWLPREDDNRVEFGLWSDGANVSLKGKTAKSGKDFFFPQTEDIVRFRMNGKEIDINPAPTAEAPFVVFAMRACDAAGMDVLDKVFLVDPKDSFYAARREVGTVVTLACGAPEDSCFCQSLGIDSSSPGGDVATWLVGDTLYWEPLTEKGEALTAAVGGVLQDAGPDGDAAVGQVKADAAKAWDAAPFAGLKAPVVPMEQTDDIFGLDVWNRLSEACLGCGTCTFVCPTCQCYDILDRDDGAAGVRRFRCWDSCMYSDFTLMAHGNPRTTQLQRFRQRFMHKLVYFPQNNDGMYSCVGCGRCVEKCPSALNIVRVMKAMETKA